MDLIMLFMDAVATTQPHDNGCGVWGIFQFHGIIIRVQLKACEQLQPSGHT